MGLTKNILEIADALIPKYGADISIDMVRRAEHWSDETEYIIRVRPWESELSLNICISSFDIRNTKVSDLISLRLDDAVKRMEAKAHA